MIKKALLHILAVAMSLVLCAVFAAELLTFARPMKDTVYDLSLLWQGEALPADWVYDDKGWTAFTQEGSKTGKLIPDGYGGFTGLEYPGQTAYFCRTMTEDLDSPTLRLGTSNNNMAVFLDDVLLYSDCPELDNRIGYLTLPTREYRTEPIEVSLPSDYVGKVLTIAQSTGAGEKQEPDTTVYPCSVTLYCGYAHESRLIAESFQAAIFSFCFFLMGLFLLVMFVWQTFHGKVDVGLVCVALATFLWLSSQMARTSFAYAYFGVLPVDLFSLCREFSLPPLLIFISSRLTGRRRFALSVLTGIQAVCALVYTILEITGTLSLGFLSTVDAVGLAILLTALIFGFREWRRGSWFFRLFCPLASVGIVLWMVMVCVQPEPRSKVWLQLTVGAYSYFLTRLMSLMVVVAVVIAVTESIHREIARQTEMRLLTERQELTQASYEAMRQQHEQVMLLRHDMVKHFNLLRQMAEDENTQITDYLDELIGQNEKIRPVIQSGNQILDIILNGKLAVTSKAGIKVEIARMHAPEKLPMSDAELCSLVMNIMDNAIAAASTPEIEHPFIWLDLHLKTDFFVFSCKNSATQEWMQRTTRQETLPKHGLGLKIIRQISQQYGDLMKTECGDDFYKITLAIPLNQSSK